MSSSLANVLPAEGISRTADRALIANLRQTIGEFSYQSLTEAGLQDVAAELFSGIIPNGFKAEELLRAGLPLLGKLVEIQRRQAHTAADELLDGYPFSALYFFPLAESLEKIGSEKSEAAAQTAIATAVEKVRPGEKLYLAIDRWQGNFSSVELFSLLQALRRKKWALGQQLVILGPSTGELKAMVKAVDATDPASENEFFSALRRVGVESIEGGSDIAVHLAAAQHGFSIIFGHDISRSRLSKVNSVRSPFLESIEVLRANLLPSGQVRGWAPWSPAVLDMPSNRTDAPLGLELLTAVAVARLLLPEVPMIRAPLSLLGCKMAHIALHFGANNLGYAAVDEDTAKHLGVIRYADAVEEFQSDGLRQIGVEEELCQVA